MAQDVTIAGASYEDVPGIEVPKTGGGTSAFYDVSDTTATAADVAQGKSFHLASGVQSSGTASYAGAPENNGNANVANAILFGTVDSTSTATAFTATVEGLDALVDGTCVMLKNGVVTSAAGFTIDVNGAGAKPVYTNLAAATAESTKFNVNYTMLFVYDSTRVSGGAWLCYNGYDSNTNTVGYQLRTNSGTKPASDTGYRYRLWFTSADGQRWVPANTSTSTNATSNRTLNTTPIDPFGDIIYYAANGTTNANASLAATTQWRQYTLTIGYSYMASGFALTYPAPVYLKATPQADGSAVMDSIVQALPSTNDGKIYVYLGTAYSATAMELEATHPVYWHDGTGVRLWTGWVPSAGGVTSVNGQTGAVTLSIPTKTSDLTNDSGFVTDAGVTSFNGSTGAVTYTAPVTSVNGSTGAVTVQPTLVSGTNIKTVNGNSLLGSGDLTISGGSGVTYTTATATLTVAGWSSNSQTVSVAGVTASNDVIVAPAPASASAYAAAGVYCSAQGAGTLTFTCTTTPTAALTANVMVWTQG